MILRELRPDVVTVAIGGNDVRSFERRGAGAMLSDFAADWSHPNDRVHRVSADVFWNVLRHSPALPAALNGLQRTFMESTPGIVVGVVDSGDDDNGDDIDLHP